MNRASLKETERMPVNLEKAEYILSLATNKQNGFKSMMTLLREIEDQLASRKKSNQSFHQVSRIMEDIYSRKVHSNQQLIHHLQSEIKRCDRQTEHWTSERQALKHQLGLFEQELAQIREYAEQRRNKKSKRERQYHQLYHVPILATQFEKKYVRARDKNSNAEEQVSHVRSKVDGCQQNIVQISKSIGDLQKQREQHIVKSQKVNTELKQNQEMMFQLQEGRKFLHGVDQYQLVTAQKATAQFVEVIQSYYAKNQNHFYKMLHPDQHAVKCFKLALFEFGEAEKVADSRWGRLQVEFNCSRCKTSHTGWPKHGKVRTDDLLCGSCYQEHHSSMVFEKKIGAIKDRSQQLLSLTGTSALSLSSSSTVHTDSSSTKSTSSSNKPGFKKMINMFKNNKRSNSDISFATSRTQDYPAHEHSNRRNSYMMVAQ